MHATGVSTRNFDLVRSLGADHVVDYTKEDFTQGEERYDAILDNVGNRSLSEYRRVLKPEGIYVLIGGGGVNDQGFLGPLWSSVRMFVMSPFVGQTIGMARIAGPATSPARRGTPRTTAPRRRSPGSPDGSTR